ncbi:sin3 histone deacetylase corepressor complex component SDS3-like isoform X2 [Littorina saxatilis]|uniref:Sin3 histone deacetylase corepressor complex component SDS3 n=1 Tax=Littorina saxatilis TaxID=31220 RepID=A0AAN9FXC0_9CAEN
MSSYTSSPRHLNEYDFDNDDIGPDSGSDFDDDREFDGNASDEDTEDASETEEKTQSGNRTEIKEQMYQDKLSQLKKQLQMLKEGTLPDYVKKSKKLHQQYQERLRQNEAHRDIELERARVEYEKEKKDADRDYYDKKIELKETLKNEWIEKRISIETERQSMDLANGDMFDMKPIMTRKLRRRPNDPIPLQTEKRRKTSPPSINQLLSEKEVMEDLEMLHKVSGRPLSKKPQSSSLMPLIDSSHEVRIDDNRLFYEKRWYQRGQAVIVESKETGKIFGQISGIGSQEIWIRRSSDNGKHKIFVSQLQKGKYTLQRRAT